MKTLALLILTVCLIVVPPVWANWIQDGVPLSKASRDQWNPEITSDGAGGAIVTWQDNRCANTDIYAQKVSASGAVLWTTDAVALCVATGDQMGPVIISDGAGGAIVAWFDGRSGNFDIYAQRVDASGAVRWTMDGVALCTAKGAQWYPAIASDGVGGAIVTWSDYRGGSSSDIYAQRVSAAGVAQWAMDGVPLCVAREDQTYPRVATDGAGGAIVTWCDNRKGSGPEIYVGIDLDIYAQCVNASGRVQWTADGVPLCTATGDQNSPMIISDGAGGAIVTWNDNRTGAIVPGQDIYVGIYDIYAQRVSAAGVTQWAADGVALCTAAGNRSSPGIVSDGAEGAIVTWQEDRSGFYDIHAQRVSASGAVKWDTYGVALCAVSAGRVGVTITSDCAGGAVVAWQQNRSSRHDIYAQRVDASGAVRWTANGVAVCPAAEDQTHPSITSDHAGGAIVAWQDHRSGAHWDIYALRVDASGSFATDGK